MQSFFQYRRLRQEVQADLARARQGKQHHPSLTDSSTVAGVEKEDPTTTPEVDSEKGGGSSIDAVTTTTDVPLVPGVAASRPDEGSGEVTFVVGWKDNDANNPLEWSLAKKWVATVTCCILCIALSLLTSVEAPSQEVFNAHFGVGALTGSMSTGIFLIGIGVGSLFSGPLSETFGRNAIYFSGMVVALLFTVGKALAPNYGAALAFRFLCATFAAAPMTVSGGTIGDIWTPMQIPFALPFMTFCAYTGPILGPVIGAYTPSIGYAWDDWISALILGASALFVFITQPETFSPLLLEWRAKHLRDLTGNSRYQAEHASAASLGPRLLTNLYRPFTMIWTEPIILIFSFYLVLLYFVLFTFLDGYPYIFARVYDISLPLTFTLWVAMIPGVLVALVMIPYLYHLTKKAAARAMAEGKQLHPEVSLYWAMAGASILLPISLFWMAWTCYTSISIWSPILASATFGYALVCIFTTTYMYLIYVYLQHAASALAFATFSRYIVAGALTPASIRMYNTIGPHWSLTISAIVATIMAPVPFVLYKYGHRVRAMSKNAQNKA